MSKCDHGKPKGKCDQCRDRARQIIIDWDRSGAIKTSAYYRILSMARYTDD